MVTRDDLYSLEYSIFHSRPFQDRHTDEARIKWGAWRWAGMCEMRNLFFLAMKRPVLDYGGALGPLGLGSVCHDVTIPIWPDVKLDNELVANHYGMLFSSHYLEHVDDIGKKLAEFRAYLQPGGSLILHVPDHRGAEWWSPEVYNKTHEYGHKRLFTKSANDGYCNIDRAVTDAGFNVVLSKYVGDNSIWLWARK